MCATARRVRSARSSWALELRANHITAARMTVECRVDQGRRDRHHDPVRSTEGGVITLAGLRQAARLSYCALIDSTLRHGTHATATHGGTVNVPLSSVRLDVHQPDSTIDYENELGVAIL